MTAHRRQPQELGPACQEAVAQIDPITGYISNINEIRRTEYPLLHGMFLFVATIPAPCKLTRARHDLS